MNDLFSFLTQEQTDLILKGMFLILIGLYNIFVIIVHNHIRSLNKLVHIQKTTGSPLIQTVSFIYLGLTLSLFVAAVVIL